MDPRANSREKLVPPAPLPYVSRRCLARVTDYMPRPTECPYCHGSVELVNNKEIYGREYGYWPYAYLCTPCNAYVGLHPKTDLPLGTLADYNLRAARKQHKATFWVALKTLDIPRGQLYALLADRMGIDKSRCHWAWFDQSECARAGEICRDLIKTHEIA